MSFKPLGGYLDLPSENMLEDSHMGVDFGYEYARDLMGDQMSLVIHSWVIDYLGTIFSRKATYLISRIDEVECITKHTRNHLIEVGIDDMSCRRLMRYFEVDNSKIVSYESIINSLNHIKNV